MEESLEIYFNSTTALLKIDEFGNVDVYRYNSHNIGWQSMFKKFEYI